MRPTPRASILLLAVFLSVVFAVAPMRAYLQQRAELADLQRQAAALEQQNTDLERRITDLNDPATLERFARECLGMVDPGEIAFVPIPKGRAPIPPDCG
jgi:cell division protein FtsL